MTLSISGAFRILVVASSIWLVIAGWLYLSGLNREYNIYFASGFDVPTVSSERIAKLPTLRHYEELAKSADGNAYLDWEGKWLYWTQGVFPELYERPINQNACNTILVKNSADSPVYFITTCRTDFHLSGFVVFLVTPLFLLCAGFFAVRWIIRGFSAQED